MRKGFGITDMNNREWIVREYCHLVNENIYFIQKHFEGIVPAGRPDDAIYWKTKEVGEQLCGLLEEENGNAVATESEINRILAEYAEYAIEYFEKREPWNMLETNRRACRNTILNSLQMVANLTVWLELLGEPFAHSVLQWLELDTSRKVHSVHSGLELCGVEELVIPVISYGA